MTTKNPFDAASEYFVPVDSFADARIDFVFIINNNLELAGQAGALLNGDLSTGHISDVLQTIHNFDLRNFVYGLYCDAYRELDEATALLRLPQPEPASHVTLYVSSQTARLILWSNLYPLITVYSGP